MRRFVPPVPRRTAIVRFVSGFFVAVSIAFTTLSAQIPGRNVNMVAGNTWPDGDPFLQRQNEPSIAASTRNPLHLLAGANDYRTVDLPGLAAEETGDAWLGLFKSYDGGQRWTSTLLPGYPQDHSALGLASPIHGYGAGADPVLRAGSNGLVYYAGLAFDRANPATPDIPGKSAIFVARYIDNNNKEAGDTFQYLGTRAIQTQPGGVGSSFLDKPWIAVDIPRDNTRCTIVTADGDDGPVTQSIPAGPVYVAYVNRSTDNKGPRYDIMFSRSTDCGATFSQPVQVNSSGERANQGAALAIDPRNGIVYIAYRQFDLTDQHKDDAIMVAKYIPSTGAINPPGFAHKFDKPKKGKGKGLNLEQFYKRGGVNRAIEATGLAPLDQATDVGTIRFRTNAYPSATVDETGRLYLVWAQRGFDPASPDEESGSARVLITTSLDGKNFTTAKTVSSGEPGQKGHQLMPTITYSGGKLMLVYYDIRESRAQSFTKYIDDRSSFQHTTPEATGLRHTIDLRSSMATPGASPVFSKSVRVSDYLEGPRYQGGPNVPWQVNPPNLPMFSKGTAPFIGDYIDITSAPNFVLDSTGKWVYNNAASSTPPIFHAVWTDNRDVRVPLEDKDGDGNPWNDYTPPGADGTVPSIFDPSATVPLCIPGNAGSRNQNIYTARITGGLLAGSPGNNKRLGYREGSTTELMERRFVVFVQNTSDDPVKRFRLTITNQPVGGRASWDQFSAAPLTVIDADVPRRSTASRTVYATSTDPHAQITINVAELTLVNNQWVVKSGGLGSNVLLNPDIDNPDIDNPDIDNPDIDNPDIDNAEIFNPDIDNPDIDNPDIDNPDIDNPDIDNPDIDNVEVANPDIDNPDIDNPDIDNPDIDNPDIDNPDIDNPDIDNTSLMSDVTWNLKNTGNTTAAYNVNLFFAQQQYDPAILTQLLLYRTYKTPVVQNCLLKTETRNVLVANVPNPHLVNPGGNVSDPNDPAATNATIYLAPGESARITLRVFDPHPDPAKIITVTNPDGSTAKIVDAFVPNEDVTPVVQQQAVDTVSEDDGVVEPPIVVQFPPPQAVNESVSTAEQTPVTVNVLANDSTAFGSTKIFSLHPDGMATHSGGAPGEIAYQPSTGFVYTSRGIIDPATNVLVGRLMSPTNTGASISSYPDPVSGLLFERVSSPTGIVLAALDTRPDSSTFHQFLSMPSLPEIVNTVAIDSTHRRLYAVHSTSISIGTSPTTVSIIDIDAAHATFLQVVGTVSLPLGVRAQSAAVNSRTQKVYIATVNASSSNGGLYVFDGSAPAPTATRIVGTTNAWHVAVNESNNQVFASFASGPNFALYVVDGASNASTIVNTPVAMRFANPEERLVIHYATGKVYMRLQNAVVVIDGQRGSPTRNQVLQVIPVAEDNGNAELAIDQDLGLIISVGSQDFKVQVIDVSDDEVVAEVPLNLAPSDVTIDQIHHKAFVSASLTSVQVLDLAAAEVGALVPVFIESGGQIVNPVTNKAYTGLFTTGGAIGVFSGSGFQGYMANVIPQSRYLFSARYNLTNQFFMVSSGSPDGTSINPGTITVIDGATDTKRTDVTLTTPPSPFGIGINQSTGKIYVGTLGASGIQGGVRIFDGNNLAAPPVDATYEGGLGTGLTNFPINNASATVGAARFLVPNPANGNVYVAVQGGTQVSFAYLDAANILHPLDGKAGTPLFDAQDANHNGTVETSESWGRAIQIRVNATANIIYVSYLDAANMVRLAAIAGTDHHIINVLDHLSHSNRHTPSNVIVNETTQKLYVADYSDSQVGILDAATLAVETVVNVPQGPSALAYNKTANRLYVSSIDAKQLTALDGTTLAQLSTVHLPLVAYFINVDEVEGRLYTSGGDAMDESGVMVITDILGKLGTNVSVSSVGTAANGTVTLNPDYSVTYVPNDGFSGVDHFNYTIQAPNGTAIGTVTVNVVPSETAPIAIGDAYSVVAGQQLNIAAPGVLANDATGTSSTTAAEDVTTPNGHLTLNADGSFTYIPNEGFEGVDYFQYHAITDSLGPTNVVNVTISVNAPSSFVVTNTNDSGTGSLRQVMTNALVEPSSVVTFNIPGGGVHTISPTFPLPTINSPITINGYSQPGSSPNTGTVAGTDAVINIEIDGAAITSAGISGLVINGGGTTVRGLAIGRFTGQGIFLDTVGGNVIEGNFIGTDATGMIARANGSGGIQVQSGGNMIGGNTAGARNVISGNTGRTGVNVTARTSSGVVQSDGSGSVVKGNLIGTNAAGTGALPNGNGVNVQVSNVIVGGATIAERNVIAGNANNGVSSSPILFDVDGTGPTPTAPVTTPDHLQVIGNYIGVTAAGNAPLGNSTGGATIVGANSTVANNVISGNGNLGLNVTVTIDGSQTSVPFASVLSEGHHTLVIGNIIGLDATGSNIIANTGNGVSVAAHDVTIGGVNAFERNVISGNTAAGISLNNSTLTPTSGPNAGIPQWRAGGDRAAIRGNYIGLSASGTTRLANTSAAMFISTNTVMVDGNYIVLGNANGINLNRGFNGATVINQGGNSTVQNNVIGLLTNGARSNGGGNQTLAISVTSPNNVIYGNIVAGNGQFLMPAAPDVMVSGINVNGAAATGNDIRNNIVGTNAAGDPGLGNTNHGIYIQDASGTNIGGYNAGDRNVVSGNARMGITIQTSATGVADNNVIWGNYVGLKPDGQTALGNGDSGILLFSSVGGQLRNTKVGGPNPGERNVIAANTIDGVSLNGPVFNNTVAGNWIGVAADGTTPRGGGGSGVFLGGGAHDNIIGGNTAADGNLVANHGATGVGAQASAFNNRILSNRIFSNGGLGIDLGFNGVTANDAGDGDGGANNQQNFPVITALSVTPSASELQGTLDSTPNTVFTLQLFRSTTCDASGFGEGAELRDTQTMGTGPSGLGFWTLTTAGPGGGAYYYTVTATDPNGNTSEFSSCLPTAGPMVVLNNNDSGAGSLRQAITNANLAAGTPTITFAMTGSTLIQLATPLPQITHSMVIDATTQAGYVNQPVVEVRGVSDTAYTGFNIQANSVTIRGLKVTNFLEGLFAMQTLNGILIEKNFVSGNANGINFRASNSTIRQNVISGNTGTALTLLIGASSNVVDANKIGVAFDGTTAMANNGNGITMYDGSNNDVIQSNTIARNGGWGIEIQQTGVLAPVQNTSIQNNRIGIDDAFAAAGNGLGGIAINNAPGTLIGTVTGNGIQFNNGPGVKVMGTSAAVIRRNAIADNNGLGIDLNGDGVTANDGATDTDSGPNDLQNFPVLNLANNDPGPRTNVTFDPNVFNPGNQFTIDFYSSPTCDASGYGEGRSYEGTTTVTGGQGSTTFMLNNLVPLGFFVTATATDVNGHTSEFSNCVPATTPPFWAASGSGTTTVTDYGGANDDTSQMTYQDNGVFSGNWAFSTTATANANYVLDYDWNGFHSFFQATAGLQVFVNRGGVDVFTQTLINAGPTDCPPCTPPSNGFHYTGTTNVTVQPGDTYGFRLSGSHLDGTLVLTGTFGVTRSVSF